MLRQTIIMPEVRGICKWGKLTVSVSVPVISVVVCAQACAFVADDSERHRTNPTLRKLNVFDPGSMPNRVFCDVPDFPSPSTVGCDRKHLAHEDVCGLVPEESHVIAWYWIRVVLFVSHNVGPLVRIHVGRLENVVATQYKARAFLGKHLNPNPEIVVAGDIDVSWIFSRVGTRSQSKKDTTAHEREKAKRE